MITRANTLAALTTAALLLGATGCAKKADPNKHNATASGATTATAAATTAATTQGSGKAPEAPKNETTGAKAETTGAKAEAGGPKPSPTTKATQTFTLGEWTFTHSAKEGFATHAKTGKKVSLWAQMSAEEQKSCDEYNEEGRLVSIVGPYVTIENISGGYCGGAHPFANHAFIAYRLDPDKAKKTERAELSSILDKKDIEAAVKADPFIKKHSKDEDFDCRVSQNYMGEHFAFQGMQDGKVIVRLGLPHGCEVMRSQFTELGLLFTPTKSLKAWMVAAERDGTLGQHLRKKKW